MTPTEYVEQLRELSRQLSELNLIASQSSPVPADALQAARAAQGGIEKAAALVVRDMREAARKVLGDPT